MTVIDDKKNNPQKPISNTTFTCVARGIPIETDTKAILEHLKESKLIIITKISHAPKYLRAINAGKDIKATHATKHRIRIIAEHVRYMVTGQRHRFALKDLSRVKPLSPLKYTELHRT